MYLEEKSKILKSVTKYYEFPYTVWAQIAIFQFTSCSTNKKSILHNLQLCPTQFISNLYHNKDHKRDHMFKTCLVNLSTWISELKCNFKRYMTSLHLAKMHTKPKQFTLKSDLREIAVFLYSTLVHWLKIYLGLAMFCLLAILILVNIYFSPSMLYGSSKARFLVKNQL